jgi:hypothetical protein
MAMATPDVAASGGVAASGAPDLSRPNVATSSGVAASGAPDYSEQIAEKIAVLEAELVEAQRRNEDTEFIENQIYELKSFMGTLKAEYNALFEEPAEDMDLDEKQGAKRKADENGEGPKEGGRLMNLMSKSGQSVQDFLNKF